MRTPTKADELASRLYSVDFALERSLRVELERSFDGDNPAAAESTPLMHAVYLALNGIRTAEDKMAGAASWMAGDMERVQRSINDGSSTYGAHLAQNAHDFDAAADLREAHRATLAALVGDEAFKAWNAARVAARKDPADADAEAEMAGNIAAAAERAAGTETR